MPAWNGGQHRRFRAHLQQRMCGRFKVFLVRIDSANDVQPLQRTDRHSVIHHYVHAMLGGRGWYHWLKQLHAWDGGIEAQWDWPGITESLTLQINSERPVASWRRQTELRFRNILQRQAEWYIADFHVIDELRSAAMR